MPITGKGYEFHIVRTGAQKRTANGKTRTRTIGAYQVFHDGKPAPELNGTTVEQKGPGSNTTKGGCIEKGRYPLSTQDGTKFKTIKYKKTPAAETSFAIRPRPGIELNETGARREILIHPGQNFLSSIGCINLTKNLADGKKEMNFPKSRKRVIAVIDDMAKFLDDKFPKSDGKRIPDAFVVIDEEFK